MHYKTNGCRPDGNSGAEVTDITTSVAVCVQGAHQISSWVDYSSTGDYSVKLVHEGLIG